MVVHRGGEQHSLSYEDLEAMSGESRRVWDQRIWDALEERDHLIMRATGFGDGNHVAASRSIHLPEEFPGLEMVPDPYEKTEDRDATLCHPHGGVIRYQYKPPSCFPITNEGAFHPVCRYCLYKFHQWWEHDHE